VKSSRRAGRIGVELREEHYVIHINGEERLQVPQQLVHGAAKAAALAAPVVWSFLGKKAGSKRRGPRGKKTT
jgi:hypothetical protein